MSGPVQYSANLGGFFPATGVLPSETSAEIVAPAPVVKSANKSKPLPPKNIVKLAKARLREINKELRRMRALEKERDELQRLVAAAEKKPVAVVTNLKKSAG